MPVRLTLLSVAMPLALVVGHVGIGLPQTAVPFSENVTVLPLTSVAPDLSVAGERGGAAVGAGATN